MPVVDLGVQVGGTQVSKDMRLIYLACNVIIYDLGLTMYEKPYFDSIASAAWASTLLRPP